MVEIQPPSFFKRGPSPLARFAVFSLLAVIFMIVDAHHQYLAVVRQGLSVVVYPLQKLANAPADAFAQVSGFFVSQATLQDENLRLKRQVLMNAVKLQRYQSVNAENAYLRQLFGIRQRFPEKVIATEILSTSRDPYSQKVIVDRGTYQHVAAGEPVIDAIGVIGQVTQAYPFSSEVTLLTDKDMAVPVKVVRNGLRAVVFGSSHRGVLDLPYMPINADIQNGDVLVTSGIGGAYPPGLPVAVVSRIERNAAYAFAKIACTPSAGVGRHQQLLILTSSQPPTPTPATPARGARKKTHDG